MKKVSLEKNIPKKVSLAKEIQTSIQTASEEHTYPDAQDSRNFIYADDNCIICETEEDAVLMKKECEEKNNILYRIHSTETTKRSHSCLLYPCQENRTYEHGYASVGDTVYDHTNKSFIVADITREPNGSVKDILLFSEQDDETVHIATLQNYMLTEWDADMLRQYSKEQKQKKHAPLWQKIKRNLPFTLELTAVAAGLVLCIIPMTSIGKPAVNGIKEFSTAVTEQQELRRQEKELEQQQMQQLEQMQQEIQELNQQNEVQEQAENAEEENSSMISVPDLKDSMLELMKNLMLITFPMILIGLAKAVYLLATGRRY